MVFKKGVLICLLGIFLVVLSLNAYSAIVVNEVLANGLIEPDSEWVEIFNNGASEVNLTNFNISETSSSNFTLNLTIPANSFIVLVQNFTLFNSTFPDVNQSGVKIVEYGQIVPSFQLSNTGGTIDLYNTSGNKIDSLAYAQSSATQENISIGRYPDGSSNLLNLSTLTPGAKNDNQAPKLNKWIRPSRNNTNVNSSVNVTINITDDTTQINVSLINLNGSNLSLSRDGDIWFFLWNTSNFTSKSYNITIFANDSYGKSMREILFNITVDNNPFIVSFSPSNLNPTLTENSTLNFSVNASDTDDALLNFSWFLDNKLNSSNPVNFSYSPGFDENGTRALNVTIKDSFSNQVSMKWTITVTNINRQPVLDSISNKLGSKSINLSFNITATDLDNDTLTFSSNISAITISKINNSIATISWKPTNKDIGIQTVNFSVSDGFLFDSKVISITINFTNNTAPNIISSPVTTGREKEKYSYDVDAVDGDNDVLSFSLKTNASGMSIDSSTGLITFTPSAIAFFVVNVSVSDLIEITNQTYNITVLEGKKFKIDEVEARVDGKRSKVTNKQAISKEAEPGSNIRFKVTVLNDFPRSKDISIEDVEVKVTIEGIDDGDDLEEESRDFDLDAEEDKSVTLNFKLPLNIDEGTFDVTIEAEGEDDTGTDHFDRFDTELEVEKERHDLRFLGFNINPTTIVCNRNFHANYEIINLGREDEDSIAIEIKNDELGLNFVEKDIQLESGTEDNTLLKSARFKLTRKIKAGVYPISANVYSDDGKLRDTEMVELKVQKCVKKK